MVDENSYLTILKPAEGIYTDKGSKFLSFIYPTKTASDFKNYVKQLKSIHPGARHFCFASRIGELKAEDRSSDDGEPSGTAGKPILNQLFKANLKQVSLIVVRYFGGTLLGKTGLIAAYKNAAINVIDNAEIILKEIIQLKTISIDYSNYNKFIEFSKTNHIQTQVIHSGDFEMQIDCEVPIRHLSSFNLFLDNLASDANDLQ